MSLRAERGNPHKRLSRLQEIAALCSQWRNNKFYSSWQSGSERTVTWYRLKNFYRRGVEIFRLMSLRAERGNPHKRLSRLQEIAALCSQWRNNKFYSSWQSGSERTVTWYRLKKFYRRGAEIFRLMSLRAERGNPHKRLSHLQEIATLRSQWRNNKFYSPRLCGECF